MPDISIRALDTDELLGEISLKELAFIVANLAEQVGPTRSYWIDAPMLDTLAAQDPPSGLIEMLRRLMGSREGVQLAWKLTDSGGPPRNLVAGDAPDRGYEEYETDGGPPYGVTPTAHRVATILKIVMAVAFVAWMFFDLMLSRAH